MLLKMFIPSYQVSFYSNSPASVKADGLIKLDSIVKVIPMKSPVNADCGTIAARVLYGDFNDPDEGYITTEWYNALTEALR